MATPYRFKRSAIAGKRPALTDLELGEMEVKYAKESQGVGTINNIFDVYPWLQSYLGAYCLGGSGSYQVRVVRG